MVAIAKKKTPADYAAAVGDLLRQQNTIQIELEQTRSRLAESDKEIARLTQAEQDRAIERQSLLAQIRQAEQAEAEQESLCSVLLGNAGTNELQSRRNTLAGLKSRQAEMINQHEDMQTADTATIRALQKSSQKDRTQVETLQQKIQALGAAREKVREEWAAVIYQDCSASLRAIEAREAECRRALDEARQRLVAARQAVLTEVAEWPSVRRQLGQEHIIQEDATTYALTAFLHLLDTFLQYGPDIDRAVAGLPHGLSGILSEMELDAATLRAVSQGDRATVSAIRERIDHALRQYRRSLALM